MKVANSDPDVQKGGKGALHVVASALFSLGTSCEQVAPRVG